MTPSPDMPASGMMTEWELRNLHVDDNRLEELREAYEHLALDPSHNAMAMSVTAGRRKSDAEHASLMAELQRHREHICRECEGRTYVSNPSANWTEDYADGRRTGQYSTNDPEEIECPRCNGVGYEPPERPKPEPHRATVFDPNEEPF